MPELPDLTAIRLRELLLQHAVSPTEVVRAHLDRLDRFDTSGSEAHQPIGAFVVRTDEAALTRASCLSAAAQRGEITPEQHPLWGLPTGDKDLYDRIGVVTGFGSRVHPHHVAKSSHPLVSASDLAGGVSLGKTSVPEYGLPCYTEPAAGRPARNPWNLERNAGGSSGGAAAAVASGMLPFALGSDGGGSVRIPAAACGLVGLKFSRDLVPAGRRTSRGASQGARAHEDRPELVAPGALARSVADAALLSDGVLAGFGRQQLFGTLHDQRDPSLTPLTDIVLRGTHASHLRVGVLMQSPWDSFTDVHVSDEARAEVIRVADLLDRLGHDVRTAALPESDHYGAAFTVLWQVGAAELPVPDHRLHELEPLTRWLVQAGRQVGVTERDRAFNYLSDYARGLRRTLGPWDIVLTPALATTARPHGWFDEVDARRNFAQQCQFTPFTSFVNVSGAPAIVLPTTRASDGLPLGVQLIGRWLREDRLLRIAADVERHIEWSDRP